MEQIRLTTGEAVLYVALIGMAAGLLLGLVPLIFGWRKGKTKLGLIGLVVSILVGAVSPLLSLVSMGIFIYLIARRPPTGNPSSGSDAAPDADDR